MKNNDYLLKQIGLCIDSVFSEMYTPKQLADKMGVSLDLVYNWVRLGLPHFRNGPRGRITIPKKAFSKWYERTMGSGWTFEKTVTPVIVDAEIVQTKQPTKKEK